MLLEDLGRGWVAVANSAIIQFNFAHKIAHLVTPEQNEEVFTAGVAGGRDGFAFVLRAELRL